MLTQTPTDRELRRLRRDVRYLTVLMLELLDKGTEMAQELDDLKAQVTENTSVIESAKTLLTGLTAKLDEAIKSGDPAALIALRDELKKEDDALAQAIVDNTPASP